MSATVACPCPELFSNLSRFDRLLGSGPVNQNMYRNCEIPPAEVIGRSVLCVSVSYSVLQTHRVKRKLHNQTSFIH